jgi:RNA polymerase-binding protein DksA
MNSRQLGYFRKMLEDMKVELSQDIDRTVHTMQDEATVFADPNDRASQESDMSLELRNRDRERKLIKKIEETTQADQEDRGDNFAHRSRRLRLLREVRRRDRPEAPRGAPHRHAVHRLQGARRNARAAGRQVSLFAPALRGGTGKAKGQPHGCPFRLRRRGAVTGRPAAPRPPRPSCSGAGAPSRRPREP